MLLLWVILVIAIGLLGFNANPCKAASIVGSYHDLSYIDRVHVESWVSVYDNFEQVCVYCHTPHGANQNVAALWNRSLPDPGSYTLYESDTLDAPARAPSPISLLCLSCHDGTIAVDSVLNMPRGATRGTKHSRMKEDWDSIYDCAACHDGWMGPGTDFTGTFLGQDFSNDHPVSIEYSTADPGLKPRPANGVFANGVKLVDNKVECVSCHDPHDPDPQRKPFLRVSNAGSALCYTCHDK